MSDRKRCQLHFNHLEDFKVFATSCGFVEVPAKYVYEALRMKPTGGGEPLIIHRRDSAKEHFTTWGVGGTIANEFFRTRKQRLQSSQEGSPK